LDAFDVTVKVPVALPETVGANVIFRVAVVPGVNVSGTLTGLMVKALPVIVTCEMVTLDEPVLLSVDESD
jgi:hypothetical protein